MNYDYCTYLEIAGGDSATNKINVESKVPNWWGHIGTSNYNKCYDRAGLVHG